MLAGHRRRAVARPARGPLRAPVRAGDDGFTITEVLVAIALVGIVMTSLTTFFVRGLAATNQQRGKQTAMQLAGDGVERVRRLQGSALAVGRYQEMVDVQLAEAGNVPGIAPYLATMQRVDDGPRPASPAGVSLPTTPLSRHVNGVRYEQRWYVGRCWQRQRAGGTCTSPAPAGEVVEFFRAVVAVTWRERGCPGGVCSYITATLVSNATTDPVYNPNTNPAPVVNRPADQVGYVGEAVNLQVTAAGGVPSLAWSTTGQLPAGLQLTSGGVFTGTPTAAAVGTRQVTVTVTDGLGRTSSAQFPWTVVPALTLTSPGAQTSRVGEDVSLQLAAAGGVGPYTWAPAPTDLPAGLTLDPATGRVTGKVAGSARSATVTVTVTDTKGKTATASFPWTVQLGVEPTTPQSPATAGTVTTQMTAGGGVAPYLWSASDLPVGLSIDRDTGRISGAPHQGSRFVSTVTVQDARGDRASTLLVWNVATGADEAAIVGIGGDHTNAAGQQVTITPTGLGFGNGSENSVKWTVTGLPSGIGANNRGVISGKPAAGHHVVTVGAEHGNQRAVYMFVWEIR